MNHNLLQTISSLSQELTEERIAVLQPLADYIAAKVNSGDTIRLNFICTHNSRRSHLSQIWAQTLGYHFGIRNLFCYSGGTEATAMFIKVAETLTSQGFDVLKLSEEANPVYAVKYAVDEPPILCFSKKYNHPFNPKNNYAAVVTCNSADEACPIVFGAEARFPIKYEDPKLFDDTDLQTEKYAERSLQIASELQWVFKQVNNK